eukprot:scaffold44093_cov37-Prasinocladus_malaysianus.AAC.1
MKSLEGEQLDFIKEVDPTGDTNGVERWLLRCEEIIADTLRSVTAEAVEAYAAGERSKWILEWPGQIVIAVSQVYWTQSIIHALDSGPGGLKQVCSGPSGPPDDNLVALSACIFLMPC